MRPHYTSERLSWGYMVALAFHVAAVVGADDESGSSATALIQQALASYPKCALTCLEEWVPKSSCQATDINCLCNNVPLNGNITVCVTAGCTPMEALATKNVSSTMCGDPVRDESATPALIGVIGGAIALFVVLLRFGSVYLFRKAKDANWDDWTIAVTMAFAIPPSIFAVLLSQNGLGKDMWTLTLQQIENVLFYYYLGELFYFAGLAANKISILLFLLRVFPAREFRWLVRSTIALCLGFGVSFFFATAFQCMPVKHVWLQLDPADEGRCNNIQLQGWMSAIFNILLDMLVLALPLPHLYRLNISLRKKIMVMIMFSLGVFVTIVSVVRLHSLILFANSENITWDYAPAAYWSTIELDVGIICACLPSLRLLFIKLGAKVLTSRDKSKGNLPGSSTMTGGRSRSHSGRLSMLGGRGSRGMNGGPLQRLDSTDGENIEGVLEKGQMRTAQHENGGIRDYVDQGNAIPLVDVVVKGGGVVEERKEDEAGMRRVTMAKNDKGIWTTRTTTISHSSSEDALFPHSHRQPLPHAI